MNIVEKDDFYEFYLILGGTLWRINGVKKIYEIYSLLSNSFEGIGWLGVRLNNKVWCIKHLGESISYAEAMNKADELRQNTLSKLS